MIDDAVVALTPLIGTRAACAAVGRPRANHYRRHRQSPRPAPAPRPEPRVQPRALSGSERQAVLDVLHDEALDAAPATVYHTLLDAGTYLASTSTMYRILRAEGEVRERRAQAVHPPKVKPELVATAANTVWSWDITTLLGPATWTYYYVYSIIDIYSRYTVGWMVAPRESGTLAERLIADTLAKQHITRQQLTIHADRGSSMASKTVAQLLADLGVTKSHSRPHVSDDNPFSEAQFKTLKYRPDFPHRFGSIEHAREHCRTFYIWYNDAHRHSGIGYHTPHDVHYGHAARVRAARAEVLAAVYTRNPERFVRKHPEPPEHPTAVWINKPPQMEPMNP